MSGIERFTSRLGGNIRESMGAAGITGAGGPLPVVAPAGPTQYYGVTRPKEALTIPIDRLIPDPDQPRKEFEPAALEELSSSLKSRGQLQPIRVRWSPDVDRWMIVAGERRYRAAILAGLPSLLCVEAKGTMTAEDILEDQLVENCLREDLRPIEQARAFRALIERRGCSYRQLAESLNVSHMAVSRALGLLNLPDAVQAMVENGELPASSASAIAKLDDPDDQRLVAERVVTGGMNRAETEEEVRKASKPARNAKGRGARPKPRKVTGRAFRTAAGTKLTIENRKGLEAPSILAALREVMAKVELELQDDQVAA